jgi:hypothetical protein
MNDAAMNGLAKKRPVSITILAFAYILVGTAGFIFHFRESWPFHWEGLAIEATEVLAVLGGTFLLRGQNWARWLVLAWMVFHVILSATDPWPKLTAHVVFCALIAWILLRPEATKYFRSAGIETN